MAILRKMVFLILVFTLLPAFLSGQTVLLEEKVTADDFKLPTEGPNYRHFGHLFLGYGFYIPENKDLEIRTKPGLTTSFEVGWRYKFKFTNWLAIGTGINYINDIFDLKQNEGKVVPTNTLHLREKMKFNNLGTEFYIRLNFGKRGNVIGKFIDLGAYTNWAFKVKHVYEDKYSGQLPAGSERVILSRLKYVEKFNYGLKARVGINRFVLTASYRLSELLTNEYRSQVGEYYFPKLAAGLEIGLFK